MVERVSELKKDLTEIAAILNQFKSEAVQLRLLELLFDAEPHGDPEGQDGVVTAKRRVKRRTNKPGLKSPAKNAAEGSSKKSKKATIGKGATSTLTNMLTGDFFKTYKTIGDIVEHSKNNLALGFKANEFSGTLARLIRSGELTRKKNADGQYEYKKP